MLIRSRMGVSADGFVGTVDGVPTLPRTIRAFHEVGALDRLELVILPILLGDGIPLSPPASPSQPPRLLRADRTFPDGSAELVYAVR